MYIYQKNSNHLEYRADIDGLRAVAILAVIGFHLFPDRVAGGFTGVDIFFVLSGYLISNILYRNLENNCFSYGEFYARRIKRIFPALILTLVAALAIGWYVLLFDEYKQLGIHIAAGSSFISNFTLWNESGYFDNSSNTKPLLHLWSLAIEEQFYIIWPIFLKLIWRKKSYLPIMIAIIIIGSFVLNIILSDSDPTASFYSPLSRFWELMIGGMLAYQTTSQSRGSSKYKNWKSSIGVILIVLGILFINNNNYSFSGLQALMPTLGTYFVISAGSTGWLNRKILSNRMLVWVGLISYPLYLWHWPLLSFARIINNDALPSKTVRLIIILITFLLAWLTFNFVENKVRYSRKKEVTITLSILMSCLLTFGLMVSMGILQPRNIDSSVNNIVKASTDWEFPNGLNLIHVNHKIFFVKDMGPEKVVFLGDSHIKQYSPRVVDLAKKTTIKSVYFATYGRCPPIPSVFEDTIIGCESYREEAIKYISRPDVDSAVIGAAWNIYFTSAAKEENTNYNYYFLQGKNKININQKEGKRLAFDSLATMISSISKTKKVYFVLDNPFEKAFDPKSYIQGSRWSERSVSIKPIAEYVSFNHEQALLRNELSQLAAKAGAVVIDPIPLLCPNNKCKVQTQDGSLIYRDPHHLRPFYVRDYVRYLDQSIIPNQHLNDKESLSH